MTKITYEKELKKRYKNIKFFCPYCRILFKTGINECILATRNTTKPYKCSNCDKIFSNNTYVKKKKSVKDYWITKTIKKTNDADNYIAEVITGFWQEGYTIDDIHIITNFSEDRIRKVIAIHKENNIVEFKMVELREILENWLLNQKYDDIDYRDLLTIMIRRLFQLGCSVEQIAKILKKSNTVITKARDCTYLSEEMLNNKEVTDERERLLLEIFLKNAIPPITKRVQRGRVTIEDQKIIMRGMTKEQEKILREDGKI